MSEQDFLSRIRSFSTASLKPVSTVVTRPDGVRLTCSSAEPAGKVLSQSSVGFVIDDKPDKRVGIILSHLIVGSMDVAQDLGQLRHLCVTHILNCCSFFSDDPFPAEFEYKNLYMMDTPEYDMLQDLEQAIKFIDSAKQSGGRCLVHCNAGVSRSTSLVIGYLIQKSGMSFDRAFQTVHDVYPKLGPNEGFVRQLKQLPPRSVD